MLHNHETDFITDAASPPTVVGNQTNVEDAQAAPCPARHCQCPTIGQSSRPASPRPGAQGPTGHPAGPVLFCFLPILILRVYSHFMLSRTINKELCHLSIPFYQLKPEIRQIEQIWT